MGKLIYSMLMSLDGYVEDAQGKFGWAAPDPEVHSYVNGLATSIGTYLYGRRMYETMVYWESVQQDQAHPPFILDWARRWQAADKIVYSRTLDEPRSARTRIERDFDPEAIRRLKAEVDHDIGIAGPKLASEPLAAGIVDELQMILFPVVVGGGKRFFPENVGLKLELLEERRFNSGVLVVKYSVRAPANDASR